MPTMPSTDADGDARGLEVRALLDVELHVGGEGPRIALGLGRLEGVEARPGHRVHEALAVRGLEVRDLARVELAGEGARAEEAGVAAFLVAPRHHGQRPPRPRAGLAQGLQALQARRARRARRPGSRPGGPCRCASPS